MSQYTTYLNSPVQVGVGGDNLAVDNSTIGTVAPGNVVLNKDLVILPNGVNANVNGTFTLLMPQNSRLIRITFFFNNGNPPSAGTITINANGSALYPSTAVTTSVLEITPSIPGQNLGPFNLLNLPVNTLTFILAGITVTGGTIQSARFAVEYTIIPS